MGIPFNSPIRDHKAWSFITNIASLPGTLFQRFLVMEMGWIGMLRELVSWSQVKLRNTWATGLDAKVRSSEFRWSHLMCIFWKTKMLREDVVWKSHYEAVVQFILPAHECFADSENVLPGKNLKLWFWWTQNNLFNSQESHRSQVPMPVMISDGFGFPCHCPEQYSAWLCNQVTSVTNSIIQSSRDRLWRRNAATQDCY